MPWNGSGTFGRQYGPTGWVNDRNAGTKILATRHDTNDDDLADGINNTLTKDGQNTPTANLPMGGFKHTGVAVATATDQYATAGQITNGGLVYLTSVAGTDTITASATPAITAYAAGQAFRFIAANTTTSRSPTLNINGLGAKNITKSGTISLEAGDILQNAICEVVYDGTQFQLTSPAFRSSGRQAIVQGASLSGAAPINAVASGLANTRYNTIYIHLNGVSLSGTDDVLIQIGDDTGFVTSGYTSRGSIVTASSASNFSSSGFLIQMGAAAAALYGVLILSRRPSTALPGADTWAITGNLTITSTGGTVQVSGNVPLNSATPAKVLDRIRFNVTGTNTFDGGTYDIFGQI